MKRTSTTAVTLFLRLVYSDLNQSGLSQRLRRYCKQRQKGPKRPKRPEGSKRSQPQRQQGPKRTEGRIRRAHPGRWQGSSQRGLKMTDFPHLFCHFLLFQVSTSSHLGSFVSPPLASFSHLSPAYSLASSRQQDSVGHSGPLGPWLPPLSSLRPSRSFRPTRSMACFSLSLASVQLGLCRSFRPFFFFFSLAERAITAVPVTALQKEAIVTSSAMPRFHQAETKNKGTQHKKQPSKTNNTTPTKHKPKTKHLSGNRAAYSCTTYN